MNLATLATRIAEHAPLPDALIRAAIGRFVEGARRELDAGPAHTEAAFATAMAAYPIADFTYDARQQHYDIPAAFFDNFLGPRLKYSCGHYPTGAETQAQAEALALAETCDDAGLADGQRILDLGAGLGPLGLWVAARYPAAHVTCVCNSPYQSEEVEARARAQGLTNLSIVVAELDEFQPDGVFDRIMSVEMFEHIANWGAMLRRIRSWLAPGGRLFLQVFAHRDRPYRFEHNDGEDWIGHYFCTGGMMPSHGLIRYFSDVFEVEAQWRWNGEHYRRTAEDWLANFDRNAARIKPILRRMYGPGEVVWARRWRLFFLLTAVLFAVRGGDVWGVSRYRLKPVDEPG